MRNVFFCAAILLIFSSEALADGDVIFDVAGNTDDESGSLARGGDGRLYAVVRANYSTTRTDGETHVIAFDPNGALLTSFGSNGKVPGEVGPIAVRSNGSIINGAYGTRTYDATGTELATFSVCGVFYPCSGQVRVFSSTFLPLPDGRSWSGGGEVFRVFQSSYWTLVRANADGTKDTAFAGNPDGWIQKDGGPSTQIVDMRFQSNSQVMVLGWNSQTGAMALSRFNLDGGTDFSFGINGVMAIGTSSAFAGTSLGLYKARNIPLGVDQMQRILVPTENYLVARRLSDGSIDNTYLLVPTDPHTSYLTFVIDSQDRIIVFGQRNDAAYVARLLPDGGLDPSFGAGGEFTFTSSAPGTSALVISDGLIDNNDRPVLYFNVISVTGARDIGLARVTASGALDTTFGVGVPDADVYPDPITFPNNTAPFGTTGVVSIPVTITGTNAATNVDIIHLTNPSTKAISIGCNGTYTQNRVLINSGQTICVRHDTPVTAGASVTSTLNIGGRVASYTTTATSTASDITPDPFSFIDQSGATPGTQVTSLPVTITGITGAAPIAINFGQYSIGCDPNGFRSSAGTIAAGQTVCVRVVASTDFATPVSTTLGINGVADTFTVTTVAGDITPSAFTYPSVSNAPQASSVMSVAITISDINARAPVSVTGGRYAINCNSAALTDQPGTIGAGQFLCLEHTSASPPGTSVTTTVTVGGYSATFTSTTAGTLDSTPEAFPFPSLTNVPPGTTATSAAVSIVNINWPAMVTVTGGEYSVNCIQGAFTSLPGTVGSGQTICVRHTASNQSSTTVTSTITVGGATSTFSSTTAAASSGGSSSSSNGGGGGAMSLRDILVLAFGLLLLRAWPTIANHHRRAPLN